MRHRFLMSRLSSSKGRRITVFVILLSVALTAFTQPALAQCSTYGDQESLALDSAVFVGKVTGVAETNWGWLRFAIARFQAWLGSGGLNRRPAARVTFEVKTSWKGVTHTSVHVDTYDRTFLKVGHEYMVFAYGPIDRLRTDVCTRTHEFFERPDEDIATNPPLTLTPGASDSVAASALPIAVIAAVAVLLVVWDLRRRSRDGGRNSRSQKA
jgi:hypothetical protein